MIMNELLELNSAYIRYAATCGWLALKSELKGIGFEGVISKFNFLGGPESRGSRFHRHAGSIGNSGSSRVFKKSKMPGRKKKELHPQIHILLDSLLRAIDA